MCPMYIETPEICIDMTLPTCMCIIAPKYEHPEIEELIISQEYWDLALKKKEIDSFFI